MRLTIRRPTSTPTAFTASALLIASLIFQGCAAQESAPKFDSSRAFEFLKRQCDFGPRPVGSEAHEKLKAYLVDELRRYADQVEIQDFRHSYSGKTYKLSNIVAAFGSPRGRGILLCAHWDTRPTADQEIRAERRKLPILGANDGASGVAVLLELARMFHERRPTVPVTIVLFDGEDFGPTEDDMFLGSRYFASKPGRQAGYKYGVLLDMVGDKKPEFHRERNSQAAAPDIVDRVWNAARRLGYRDAFPDDVKYAIRDDHVPLIENGLPCIDIIDFDYAYWHTLEDTVDKCSPRSLGIVGQTIAEVVYAERP